jgi:hypothetical protein
MGKFQHPVISALGRRLVSDVQHDLAVVFLATAERSVAIVVAERESGTVLGWDGFYNDAGSQFPKVTSLADLDWDEWDDMPSKLVLQVQGPWLADFVGYWLMPSYSVAREAAGLVRTNHDLGPEQVRQLLDSVPVAYLPIVDRDVFERDVAS